MPNKCAVFCFTFGYTNGPRKPLFHFPKSISQQEKLIAFLNRRDYTLTPIPTINPSAIPKSQKMLPKKPRKLPFKTIYL